MSQIRYQDTDGTKGTLPAGNLGYDAYTAGGDEGRLYVGDGTTNIALAKKSEVDAAQPVDAGLTSIAGLTTAADKMIYTTALDTYSVIPLTVAGRALLDDADASAQRTTLGLVIGTDVQAYDATNVVDADIGTSVQAYDADTAKTDVAQTFTAPQRGTVTTDNDLSFALGTTNNFKCTPIATGQLTFTGLTDGQGGSIRLDNSGGHVITKNAIVLASSTFLDTISATGEYLIGYECDGTNVFINSTEALS